MRRSSLFEKSILRNIPMRKDKHRVTYIGQFWEYDMRTVSGFNTRTRKTYQGMSLQEFLIESGIWNEEMMM